MLTRGQLAKMSRAAEVSEELENEEMEICNQLGLPVIYEAVTQLPAGELQTARAKAKGPTVQNEEKEEWYR